MSAAFLHFSVIEKWSRPGAGQISGNMAPLDDTPPRKTATAFRHIKTVAYRRLLPISVIYCARNKRASSFGFDLIPVSI